MTIPMASWDILPAPANPNPASLQSAPSEPLESISGEVDRILHYVEDTGFTVFVLRNGPYQSTVTGITARLQVGEGARCLGQWSSSKWGRQFRAERIEITEPNSKKALHSYLCSGAIPGIGPHFADLLLNSFGEKLMDVLEAHPEQLKHLPGIGPKRLARLLEHVERLRNERKTMVFLLSHGLGPGRAARIAAVYKGQTEAILRENPYRMATEVEGIGFRLADELARKLGIAANAPARLEAGLLYSMEQAEEEGHTFLSITELKKAALDLLRVPEADLLTALQSLLQQNRLIRRSWPDKPDCLYRPSTDRAEQLVSDCLLRLRQGPLPWPETLSQTLPTLPGITLSAKQQEAVRLMLQSKVAILRGGPGVGKTTITKSMLMAVQKAGIRVALCAPTGKAAKRMSEATETPASTIHRLLEIDGKTGGFKHHEKHPLPYDLFVVDEASMIDVRLAAAFLRAIAPGAGLWIVGDPEQIPSVGAGAVLQDLLRSRQIPVATLDEIFRQSEASRIIVNSHRIIRGEMPEIDARGETDFYFFRVEDPEAIPDKVLELVLHRIPRKFGVDPVRDIQVLTHLRKGPLGSDHLAQSLQQRLLPSNRPILESFGRKIGKGDRVMQQMNDYEKTVYNGETGQVLQVSETDKLLTVDFDGRIIDYHVSELYELALAYALTIHKSQGSEYPVVVLPISTSYHIMLERHLLYTGVTRGRRLVVLVGQPKALAVAVRTQRALSRNTTLAERLLHG
jgi:exodeoxyribonuclease V alpha subunit